MNTSADQIKSQKTAGSQSASFEAPQDLFRPIVWDLLHPQPEVKLEKVPRKKTLSSIYG